eukprot:gb/GECG01012875.1/.p1 GENE.gb/GECG01012875.1/~~gb/GECG01012875.1/.p1  ORF type:complete len:117 (+),score=7.20 gb/GECG01012875.1/:1-351(+)
MPNAFIDGKAAVEDGMVNICTSTRGNEYLANWTRSPSITWTASAPTNQQRKDTSFNFLSHTRAMNWEKGIQPRYRSMFCRRGFVKLEENSGIPSPNLRVVSPSRMNQFRKRTQRKE